MMHTDEKPGRTVPLFRRFGAKPDKKIVDRSSGKSEFMEDTVHGNSVPSGMQAALTERARSDGGSVPGAMEAEARLPYGRARLRRAAERARQNHRSWNARTRPEGPAVITFPVRARVLSHHRTVLVGL